VAPKYLSSPSIEIVMPRTSHRTNAIAIMVRAASATRTPCTTSGASEVFS
jgi:hypothetical protein